MLNDMGCTMIANNLIRKHHNYYQYFYIPNLGRKQ